MKVRYSLQTDTARVPLEGGSILVGRSHDCDVVLQGERVSRHHALVRVVEDGVEVVPLGGRSIEFNGEALEGPRRLTETDRFEIEGSGFALHTELVPDEPDVHWFVECSPGVLVRVGENGVSVGGGDDGIIVTGWPAGVIALAALGDRLVLEAKGAGVRVGRALEVGEMTNVGNGDTIAWGAVVLRVLALPSDPSKPTAVSAPEETVSAAVLTILPRGGNLALRIGARVRRVHLVGKRAEIVALLLRPPSPYGAGEPIPDAVIAAALWPETFAGRTDINTLLWRVRKDLAGAGLDRVNFFDRAGGALRVRLAKGARVEVKDIASGE